MSISLGRRRLWLSLVIVALVIAGALAFAYHFTVSRLQGCLVGALGPSTHMGETHLSWDSIELDDLHVAAPPGFPASEQLRATHMRLVPRLSTLWHPDLVSLSAVDVYGGRLVAVRNRQGKLLVAPALFARNGSGATGSVATGCEVQVTRFRAHDLEVEFLDQEVRNPAHRIVLTGVEADLGDVHYPVDSQRINFKITGAVRSVAPGVANGTLDVSGWLVPENGDSDLNSHLSMIDLVALEPYLLRATEAGVRHGTLDLEMQAHVRDRRINAPGILTLRQLELSSGGSGLATFMGVPRQAVVEGLKDHKGDIQLHFELDGNVDDPNFSLKEGIGLQAGTELAKALGITFGTLVKGVGGVGQTGLDLGEQVVKGVGSAVGGLLHH
jgi:hypothetical protein